MTVQQLISVLETMPQNIEVHFAYDFGDQSHTTVAPLVQSIDKVDVVYSDYHRMDKVIDADREDAGNSRRVVILNS
jgi:hypothetical protein